MREAAETRGLSRKELAEKMHKSAPLISMWWSGARNPSADDIAEYARIVGIPVEHLLEEERRLPENHNLRQRIDKLLAEVEEIKKATEAPREHTEPEVPEDVRIAIEQASSRQEKIEIAFNYLLTLDLRLGSSAMGRYPLEAKLSLVRMYERLSGRKLLPEDLF